MGTLAINAGDRAVKNRLRPALARLAPGAPIVVMVHGFRYSPFDDAVNPHRHILSDAPQTDHWKAVSWPRELGLSGGQGLGIGFGWSGSGSIWSAYQRARHAGDDLARLLGELRRIAPSHPVHLVGHSLGTRVGLLGMAQAPGVVRRAILISPAFFLHEAARLAPQTGSEVFSILGRENTAFDLLLRAALPHQGCTLGRGGPDCERWLDIRLGAAHVREALAEQGHAIAPARRRVCHWSGYLREGIWDFYRALIHRPAETPLPLLRARLAPPVRMPEPSLGTEMPWGPGQAV